MNDDAQVRIGTAEREQALTALTEHHAAGRLDADEFEDRRGRANDAITRGDLTALFVDLPGGRPAFGSPSGPSTGSTGSTVSAPSPTGSTPAPVNRADRRAQRRGDRTDGIRGGQQNRWRGVVALSPFVALALFFITKSWLWFLLVPVAGIVAGTFGRDDD